MMKKLLAVFLLIQLTLAYKELSIKPSSLTIKNEDLMIGNIRYSCLTIFMGSNTKKVFSFYTPHGVERKLYQIYDNAIHRLLDDEYNVVDNQVVACVNTSAPATMVIGSPPAKKPGFDFLNIKLHSANTKLSHCSSENGFVKFNYFKLVDYKNPETTWVYCKNESVYLKFNALDKSLQNCSGLIKTKKHIKCDQLTNLKTTEMVDCEAKFSSNGEDGFDLTVVVKQKETFSVSGKGLHFTKECSEKCLLKVPDSQEYTVTCSNGKQHKFQKLNNMIENCIYLKYFNTGRFGQFLCKSSSIQILAILWIIWLIIGKLLIRLVLSFCDILICVITCITIKVHSKLYGLEGYCDKCCQVLHLEEKVKHRNCHKGFCPYCINSFDLIKLPAHAKSCKARDVDVEQNTNFRKENNKFYKLIKTLNSKFVLNAIWILTLLVLISVTISPVNSQILKMDFFEEVQYQLENCKPECTIINQLCICPKKTKAEENWKNLQSLNRTKRSELAGWQKHPVHGGLNTAEERKVEEFIKEELNGEIDRITKVDSDGYIKLIGNGNPSEEKDKKLIKVILGEEASVIKRSAYPTATQETEKSTLKPKEPTKVKNNVGNYIPIVIDTDWRLINVEKAYKPANHPHIIELVWNDIESSKDSVTITGSSFAFLELEKLSGIVWKVGSRETTNTKTLSVSIYDYTQKYKTELEYLTVDREVSTWTHGYCFKNCDKNCNAGSKGYSNIFENAGCNAAECPLLMAGCTCCGAEMHTSNHKWLLGSWKVDFESISAIVCVDLTGEERVCKEITDADDITVGGVSVHIGNVQGMIDYLPNKIATMRSITGDHTDLTHVDSLIMRPNICAKQVCQHGRIGDIQLSSLTNDDTFNYDWTTWSGLKSTYICKFLRDPTCSFNGLESANTYRFNNLNETGTHVTSKFTIQNVRVLSIHEKPQLLLRVKPQRNHGQIQISIESEGLQLTKMKAKDIQIESFEIIGCEGFYGTLNGFECQVEIVSRVEDPIFVELMSTDKLVELTVKEFPVSTNHEAHKVTGFTLQPIRSIEICIKGTSHCAIKETKLKEPKNLLSEHFANVLTIKNNGSCFNSDNIIECSFGHAGNYWTSLYYAAVEATAIWKYILYASLTILVIWFFLKLMKKPEVINIHTSRNNYNKLK